MRISDWSSDVCSSDLHGRRTIMPLDLICPAGSLVSLKTAIDHGADAVYMGFRDNTNARAFPGLNFDEAQAAEGLRYAHDRGRKVLDGKSVVEGKSGSVRLDRGGRRISKKKKKT